MFSKEVCDNDGQVYTAKSNERFVIIQCKSCGKPIGIKILAIEPKITRIIFRNNKNEVMGIFEDPILPEINKECYYCHFINKF